MDLFSIHGYHQLIRLKMRSGCWSGFQTSDRVLVLKKIHHKNKGKDFS